MKTLQSFEIFGNIYPVAEDNILSDLHHHGGFIQGRFSLFLHFTL
jgi:hypothetical protein